MSKDKKPKNPVKDEQENKEWGGSANRVARGGHWNYYSDYLRSSWRSSRGSSFHGGSDGGGGFRIVKNIPKEKRDE